jgi:hypothetical protein
MNARIAEEKSLQTAQTRPKAILLVAALTFLSWLGAYVHTILELQLPVWAPENSVPALIGFLLFLGWWKGPGKRRFWIWALLGWTVIAHLLVGALLSVLPLPLWPFYPEQSLEHYLSHLFYAVTQLPLAWVLWQELKQV